MLGLDPQEWNQVAGRRWAQRCPVATAPALCACHRGPRAARIHVIHVIEGVTARG
jgi:hypothetical protein